MRTLRSCCWTPFPSPSFGSPPPFCPSLLASLLHTHSSLFPIFPLVEFMAYNQACYVSMPLRFVRISSRWNSSFRSMIMTKNSTFDHRKTLRCSDWLIGCLITSASIRGNRVAWCSASSSFDFVEAYCELERTARKYTGAGWAWYKINDKDYERQRVNGRENGTLCHYGSYFIQPRDKPNRWEAFACRQPFCLSNPIRQRVIHGISQTYVYVFTR